MAVCVYTFAPIFISLVLVNRRRRRARARVPTPTFSTDLVLLIQGSELAFRCIQCHPVCMTFNALTQLLKANSGSSIKMTRSGSRAAGSNKVGGKSSSLVVFMDATLSLHNGSFRQKERFFLSPPPPRAAAKVSGEGNESSRSRN